MRRFRENINLQIIQHLKQISPEGETARQLAKIVMDNPNNEEYLTSRKQQREELHDSNKLLTQLAAEVQPHKLWKLDNRIERTNDRPFKLRYNPKIQSAPSLPKGTDIEDEVDLYPSVIEWLKQEGFKALRINEREARGPQRRGQNRWLFPDIVGIRDINRNLDKFIREARKGANMPHLELELWALEVKKELNMSNHRQHYFQAVSNSAWANEGYLVATEFDEEEDIVKELRMLAQLHGIGVVRLDVGQARGEVLVPARRMTNIDWHIANRLYQKSKTFGKIIASMTRFHKTGGEDLIIT